MSFRDTYATHMPSKRPKPTRSLPRIQCDFNSVGWSGDDDDDCYYSFDEKGLAKHRLRVGLRVFIYEPSRDNLVMGCEAILEQYRHPIADDTRWRLRPVPNTGYLGELH
jgi:hypothetical protein